MTAVQYSFEARPAIRADAPQGTIPPRIGVRSPTWLGRTQRGRLDLDSGGGACAGGSADLAASLLVDKQERREAMAKGQRGVVGRLVAWCRKAWDAVAAPEEGPGGEEC